MKNKQNVELTSRHNSSTEDKFSQIIDILLGEDTNELHDHLMAEMLKVEGRAILKATETEQEDECSYCQECGECLYWQELEQFELQIQALFWRLCRIAVIEDENLGKDCRHMIQKGIVDLLSLCVEGEENE